MSETAEALRDINICHADCHGCRGCVDMAPGIFQWNEQDDRPLIVKDGVTEEEVREAMAFCPRDCIHFNDE